jgi:hypothetical protein
MKKMSRLFLLYACREFRMKGLIPAIFFAIVLIVSSCAHRVYDDRKILGTVDSETEVVKSTEVPAIEIYYSGGSDLSAVVSLAKYITTRTRTQAQYEQCWQLSNQQSIDNIGDLVFALLQLPFAILEEIAKAYKIIKPERSGCAKWVGWEAWEAPRVERKSSRPFSGRVIFSVPEFKNAVISPLPVPTDSGGVARAHITYTFPYMSELDARSMKNAAKRQRPFTIMASAAGFSTTKDLHAYDVSAYLETLFNENFREKTLTAVQSNSRLPLRNTRLSITVPHDMQLAPFVDTMKQPGHVRAYLKEYLEKNKRAVLDPSDRWEITTDEYGRFHCIVPKSKKTLPKVSVGKRNYFNVPLEDGLLLGGSGRDMVFLSVAASDSSGGHIQFHKAGNYRVDICVEVGDRNGRDVLHSVEVVHKSRNRRVFVDARDSYKGLAGYCLLEDVELPAGPLENIEIILYFLRRVSVTDGQGMLGSIMVMASETRSVAYAMVSKK